MVKENVMTTEDHCGSEGSWLNNVTAIIKTLERPDSLDRLIRSIRKFYPALKVIVADDSEVPVVRDDVEFLTLPFDSGVGKGRNLLLDQVRTKYFITLDDDFIFTEKTRLEIFYEILENTPFNLVGGVVMDGGTKTRVYHGSLNVVDDTLVLTKQAVVGFLEDMPVYDIVLQFFMAESQIVQKARWHDDMKTFEHEEFFFRNKNKFVVTHTKKVVIDHSQDLENKRYMRFRNRTEFLSVLYQENNLKAFEVIES